MRYWLELDHDVFSFFQWFSKDKVKNILGYEPKLSVFSINGSMIFNQEDKKKFNELCGNILNKVASQRSYMENFRYYLFVIEISNNNPKISVYLKLWKKIMRKWDLSKFILGPEVEYVDRGNLYYTGIAEFNLMDLPSVLEIVGSNSGRYSIFASRKQNILTKDYTRSLFDSIFIIGNRKKEIDIVKMVLKICIEGDLVFRWGDSSEECELDIIIPENNLQVFDGISLEQS
ncbi:hypothetical protein ERICIV_01739 [Paenibacillus larvae subsp. larvae]|uniref:Uncharacterized protein n=1 Tax=Paenibacillus larvae subsp. larvae TaxID=147375 RepID=A0A2L1UCL8_9BACL|nr:hypothetical protein [Paenibacillus larvae]AQZ47985.1 hypothetical protein B5S25_16720 [Paenibacillus larvae subsp. pulvifaciens]AVF25896.1 hypothetical protein ERICIII_01718 [Paenibacillus larvae subsp. larvae]AVF30673.1 hypothetical protein ERICIV_01739 [Paenibacillus larvae subsp. larvae]MCY7522294.1 hypothetical protein [Paenibacillus larvae]MCY9503022.1 hypothetical protein [Paenibacillus larvae]